MSEQTTNELFAPDHTATPTGVADLLPFARINADMDEGALRRQLEKMGRLPRDFDEKELLQLLGHSSAAIRLLAVKNLGELKREALLERMRAFALSENNTLARREAVSAIGRMKTPRAIPTFVNLGQMNFYAR